MSALALSELLLVVTCVLAASELISLQPPAAQRVPWIRRVQSNDEVVDYYNWLRNETETRSYRYIEEENEFAVAAMNHTHALQAKIAREMLERRPLAPGNLTFFDFGSYRYFKQIPAGRAFAAFTRQPLSGGAEQLLLDLNALAKHLHASSPAALAMGVFEVSPDERKLAFSVSSASPPRFDLFIRDLQSGSLLRTNLSTAATTAKGGDASDTLRWAGNRHVFFTVPDVLGLPRSVFRWAIDSPASSASLVYRPDDPGPSRVVSVSTTNDGAFLVVDTSSNVDNWPLLLDSANPLSELRPLLSQPQAPPLPLTRFQVEHHGSFFYVRTNALGNCSNFAVLRVAATHWPLLQPLPPLSQWQVVLPCSRERWIDLIEVFERHLVAWTWRVRDGLRQLLLIDLELELDDLKGAKKKQHADAAGARDLALPLSTIPLPGDWTRDAVFSCLPGTVDSLQSRRHRAFHSSTFVFTMRDALHSAAAFEFDMTSKPQAARQIASEAPAANYDAPLYSQARLFASAEDGTRLPMTLVYRTRKLARGDGGNPVLM